MYKLASLDIFSLVRFYLLLTYLHLIPVDTRESFYKESNRDVYYNIDLRHYAVIPLKLMSLFLYSLHNHEAQIKCIL